MYDYLQVSLCSRGPGFELDGEDGEDKDVEDDAHCVPEWTGYTVLCNIENNVQNHVLYF